MTYSEDQHQINVFKWTQQPAVRQRWPELELLFHIPNERKCDPRQGKKLRLMGVRRGVPDLFLPVPRGKYPGLWIEMKTETGCMTADQEWWRDRLLAQGYAWELCHGWKAATRILEWYMSLPADETHERTEQ